MNNKPSTNVDGGVCIVVLIFIANYLGHIAERLGQIVMLLEKMSQ